MPNSVQVKIAEALAAINPTVEEAVVNMVVAKEVDRRANDIAKALDTLDKLQKDVYKVDKPDLLSFNADGSQAGASYSQERLKAIKEAKEKLEKCEKAVEKALGGDFGSLKPFLNSPKD